MKQAYQQVVDRFLADHGGSFRFLRARWWHLGPKGSWVRDGRLALEQTLVNLMIAYFPDARMGMNQVDMNQMCAFLAAALATRDLPGRYLGPGEDQGLLRPWMTRSQ